MQPPNAAVLAELAERALAAMPPMLLDRVRGIPIAIEEIADDATLDELGIESGWDLTGLYRGTPRHRRATDDLPRTPDLVVLYRQPILLEWIETDEDLFALVRTVLVHEIAHHFGFSDADIDALER